MATGESRWSGEGRETKRLVKTLIPNGIYPLELKADPRIDKADRPDAFPYVKCAFVAQGTAGEGGKDRWVFHQLYLGLNPGSDGVVMADRGGQLVELGNAFGDHCEAGVLTLKDKQGKELGKYLDPKDVQEWLNNHAGNVINGKVYIEKAKKDSGFEDQNKIEFFEPAGGEQESGEEEEPEQEEEKPAARTTAKKPLPKKR